MSGKHEYEFFGPFLGPVGIMLGLPAVNYFLYYGCSSSGCLSLHHIPHFGQIFKTTPLATQDAFMVIIGWLIFQLLLHLLLPGKRAEGAPLQHGERLVYKLTGFSNLLASVACVLYLGWFKQWINLSWAYDNFLPLLTAATVLSTALAAAVYLTSFQKGTTLAEGGSTGIFIYDFFMGRGLNPRIRSLDIKEFCELYPGLIGWLVLDICMAHKQYENLGRVTPSMTMVCAFQALYVFDSMWFEQVILTTMDIRTEGFGFMLSFGDLAWVPFVYCLQARYLVDHPQELPVWAIVCITALQSLGYAIFRLSNSQKDAFRRDPSHPSVRHLRTIATATGRKLLVSGWWGTARHINYLGDWLMGLAWCLPCGLQHPVPYFYAIYFAVLLIHRDRRDDDACRKKYGKAWDEYCRRVPSRLIPYVY